MLDSADDLDSVLSSWKYDADDSIRRVVTASGREVLRVRLPLGIEQYEIHGRPDGKRPRNRESWFDVYRELAASTSPFSLDEESHEALKAECLLYYSRYLLFFQVRDYRLCARDTRRHLDVLDFVAAHGAGQDTRILEQYRPYALRLHVLARALGLYHDAGDAAAALVIAERGRAELIDLPPGNKVFELERRNSRRLLEHLIGELREALSSTGVEKAEPAAENSDESCDEEGCDEESCDEVSCVNSLEDASSSGSPQDSLRSQLQEAITCENYEEAARLRDEIAQDEPGGDVGDS